MAEKKFNVRLQLKYDTLENWVTNNPVLKAGETALATIKTGNTETTNSVAPPQILTKVGDGQTAFNDLPYTTALAADVYTWAKKSKDNHIADLIDWGFASQSTINNITALIERLQYYGDSTIEPTDESYFTVDSTGTCINGLSATGKASVSGTVVFPYKIDNKIITQIVPQTDILGEMRNIFYGSTNSVTKVIIPNSVSVVGSMAFPVPTITSVNIPDGIEAIESCVFMNSGITSIKIPDSVTTIKSSAFAGTSSLKEVVLPNSVDNIYDSFSGSSIEEIKLSKNIGTIPGRCFSGCSNLKTVDIPYGVIVIEGFAFAGCTSLTKISIPSTVTDIADEAFSKVTDTGTINPPILEGITIYCEQGSYADTYAKSKGINVVYTEVKDIVTSEVAEKLQYYGDSNIEPSPIEWFVLNDAKDTITGLSATGKTSATSPLVLPYKDSSTGTLITTIGNDMYPIDQDATNTITKIVVPSSVTTFKEYAFASSSLQSINIPESITSLPNNLFNYSSLMSISIPNTVTSVGSNTFAGTKLKTITFPDSVTSISANAVPSCQLLESVKLPRNITTIESCLFDGCSKLKSIEIPYGVTSIQDSAFIGCTSLVKAIIPNTVTSIETASFSMTYGNPGAISGLIFYCEKGSYAETYAKTKNIPVVYTDIEESYFDSFSTKDSEERLQYYGDATIEPSPISWFTLNDAKNKIIGLTDTGKTNMTAEVVIPYKDPDSGTLITSIVSDTGESIFTQSTTSITKIIIPRTLVNFDDNYVFSISTLKTVILPDTLTTITNGAFMGCSSLESISIPNSVTTIDSNAFGSCSSLKSLYIPDSVTTLGSNSITNCTALETVRLSNNLTTINDYTFEGCTKLNNLIIPDSVTTIGDAFISCAGLKKIVIPDTVTSIGDKAFYTSLESNATLIEGLNIYCPQGSYAMSYAFDKGINVTNIYYTDVSASYLSGIIETASEALSTKSGGTVEAPVTFKDTVTFEKAPSVPNPSGTSDAVNKGYVDDQIEAVKSGESATPEYKAVTLNTSITGVKEGLAKFTLTGLVQPCNHNPGHGNVLNHYVPLQHTIGTLNISDSENNTYASMEIELYGRNANDTRGFATAKDELTEKYLKRVWSKDFMLSMEYHTSTEACTANTSDYIHTFTIPTNAFGTEIPKTTGVIEPVCSFAYPRTKTEITTTTTSSGNFISMEYVEADNSYKVYIRSPIANAKSLFDVKYFIVYELATPVYDYHTNKLFIKEGSKITFTQRSVESFTTSNSTPAMSTCPLTATIQAPTNSAAVLEGFEQTSFNLNDLNTRVDNIEVSSRKIGAADGSTDDSDAIQLLINNAETETGLVTDVVIPEGIYALGKSLEITKSNIKLIGDGNVIFKPTGNFPAIKIYRPTTTSVEDVSVENISIWLPNTAYLDGDFAGSHSGIYIDGSYAATRGLYRVTIKDVSIHGVYRYATQDTDKSYGIYFKDNTLENTFAYFCTIENVKAMSVYCGLYLGEKVNCTNVTGFHWDISNVYNYSGGDAVKMGVAYGIICRSTYNTIDFRGQSFGDDHGSWVYKDYDKNVYSLATVVGENNVKVVDGLDYFIDDYNVKAIESITVENKTIDVFLGRNNLSKAGILCSGTFNTFKGHIYDPQRSDYQYIFTSSSRYNRYYYPTAFYLWGSTHSYTSFNVDLYGTGDKSKILNLEYDILKDVGYENKCLDYIEGQMETLVSDNFVDGVDADGSNIGHSPHFGIQDNALSYVNKFSTINVYQLNGETQTPVTVNNESAASVIGDIFDPKSTNKGFRNGITFDQIPTLDNPIYIDIDINPDHKIEYISRFGIQFNQYICRTFDILVQKSGSDTISPYGITDSCILNNNNVQHSFLAYHVSNDGDIKTWDNIVKIRIILKKGLNTGTYNPNGKVGISLIWATDAQHGGNSWLPRGGGEVYGDLKSTGDFIATINDTTHKLSEKANKAATLEGYGITDAYDKNTIDSKISSVYRYKGTIASTSALPTENLSVGDVYNIETSGTIGSGETAVKVNAGDNVAWVQPKDATGYWDVLAGTVDLSVYYTKTEVDTKVENDLASSIVNNLVSTDTDKSLSALQGKTLKAAVDKKLDAYEITTSITNNALLLNDRSDNQLTNVTINTLTLTTPDSLDRGYQCSLSFKTGLGKPSVIYSATPIKWCGVDCDKNGDFTPQASTNYEVSIKCLGLDSLNNPIVIARVGVF